MAIFKIFEIIFQSTDQLLHKSVLLDPMLTSKQAQKLLRLICMQHKNGRDVEAADDPASQRRILTKILENLDEWNLRISTVDVKLMYHQLFQSGKIKSISLKVLRSQKRKLTEMMKDQLSSSEFATNFLKANFSKPRLKNSTYCLKNLKLWNFFVECVE